MNCVPYVRGRFRLPSQVRAKTQNVQVISRAAEILRLLARETGGLSLGQIATRVDLPRSTVQRIVSALAKQGLVSTEQGNGGIRLGPEIQRLAQASTADVKDRLRPAMRRISESTGETVDLAVLDGNKMLFIDQIVGSQRLRAVSSIGARFPLTTTANGKAALACMDHADAEGLIRGECDARTANSKSAEKLLEEIDRIRTGGLATDENEHTDGICALGFAFREQSGDIYAVSTPVPGTRYERVKGALSRTLLECRELIDR